jgi:hypothetical protein
MMNKLELIAQYRLQHPTLRVGSEESGYTILNPEEYEQTLSDWADAALKYAATAYIEKRQAEYPPITDYLDGIVKGDQAQVQAYIDACLAVKAKYPKGG